MRAWVASVWTLFAMLTSPCSVEAGQICGQDVVAFDQTAASIKALDGVAVTRETDAFIEIADEKQLILWTLIKPRNEQPAAVICRKVVQDGAQTAIKLSAECIGTTLGCDGVISRVLAEQNRATAPLRR